MAIDPFKELLNVLPPPKRTMNATGDWGAIEAAIGLRLPADYKAFISVYGSGMINCCLEIVSPFEIITDIREWWIKSAEFYNDIAAYQPVSYPIFPSTGGLLPFGTLGDVNRLNWHTVGEPNEWPFVYYDRDEGFFEIKGLTAVGFVLEAVTRRSPLLARLGAESVFDPASDFEAYTPEPLQMQLVHPREIDIDHLVDRLAGRWPSEQVRIRRRKSRVTLLVEPLEGSISISREGDERTWCWLRYDKRCADQAAALVQELKGLGFA